MRKIVDSVARVREHSGAVSIGVSGFGGSGKSTLARALVAAIPGSVRIRGDDFLDPARSHQRSPDWDGVERLRLRREVLDPFVAVLETVPFVHDNCHIQEYGNEDGNDSMLTDCGSFIVKADHNSRHAASTAFYSAQAVTITTLGYRFGIPPRGIIIHISASEHSNLAMSTQSGPGVTVRSGPT